jgi:hypothetical protein
MACVCHPRYNQVKIRGSWSRLAWRTFFLKQDLFSKIARAKRARGIAQAIEYPSKKSEVLNSNPRSARKKLHNNTSSQN